MYFYINYYLSDEIKIKGSIFKIFSYHVENHNEVKERLKKIEEKYNNASHICYGYRLCDINNLDLFFNPQVIEYSTDAGEPSGTAGKPILNTLKKNKIVNRVVFVVRYFGGTKLGIAGLIEAYKSSTEVIFKDVELKKWILYKKIKFKVNYTFYKIINDLIFKYEGNILENKFLDDIELSIQIPYASSNEFIDKIINKSKGTIIILE